MRAVVALDLDQTMIFSSAGAHPGETVWVEELDGAPLSLMTVLAHAQLADLAERHHVVPVTTRTPEQLGRVRIPGRHSHAICANGGVLLVDGARDRLWDVRVARELAGCLPAADVLRRLTTVADEPWVRTVRPVEDLFAYLVAHDRESIPAGWVADLEVWAAEGGWSVSVQGRKVYVVPELLSKGTAAVRVAELLGGPLLAAGDSLLDRSLLEQAAVAVRPAHGELHEAAYDLPGLHVTAASGVAASEEILALLSSHADALGLA